jgi:hypothetical protein
VEYADTAEQAKSTGHKAEKYALKSAEYEIYKVDNTGQIEKYVNKSRFIK